MSNPLNLPIWQQLQALQKQIAARTLSDLFDADDQRFQGFSLSHGNLFLDYSKNFVNGEVMNALFELARHQQLADTVKRVRSGQALTPGLPAIPYTALRDRSFLPLCIDGRDISSEIRNALFAMRRLCESVQSRHWRGYNGKPITDVVTLGVGGSGNGAEMVCRALAPYQNSSIKSHFVANADHQAFKDKLSQLHPDTTLFIISSKSLATHETLQNAQLAKHWLLASAGSQEALKCHFVAITANSAEAERFGLPAENILPVWDWLPGRYSLWTTAGLPIALAIGMDRFEQLLDGAHQMDQHFADAPLPQNLPAIIALLGIWYTNFWEFESRAILPYSELLEFLPGYLQHNLMETCGKSVDLQGKPVNYSTSPIIWGSAGTKNQHTYFQLLHQGTQIVPTEFIVVATDTLQSKESASAFFHFLAQSETLMLGNLPATVNESGNDNDNAINNEKDNEQRLPGNRPSTCLLLKDLSPFSLGQLLALYEHVSLTQSILWNINPFSHWGTEMGKRYSAALNNASPEQIASEQHDGSTLGLLARFHEWRESQHQTNAPAPSQEESTYSVF